MMENFVTSFKEKVSQVKTFLFRFLIAIAILLVAYIVIFFVSYKTIEVTIKNKDRTTTGTAKNLTSKYMVYATDEVFENTDAFLFGKFNSSDVQNKLTAGQTYKVKVVGWRVPILSRYRNIISIKDKEE